MTTPPYPGVLIPADGKPLPKELQLLPRPALPKVLYRHRGKSVVYIEREITEAKKNRKCYVSRAETFPDPFELKPDIDRISGREYWSFLKAAWEIDPDFLPFGQSVSNIAEEFSLSPEELRERIFFGRRQFCFAIHEALVKKHNEFIDKARIVCFVKRNSDARMWDVYSAGNEGVLFEFQRDLEHLRSFLGPAGPGLKLDPGPCPQLSPEKIRIENLEQLPFKESMDVLARRYSYRAHCNFGSVVYSKYPVAVSELDLLRAFSRAKDPWLHHILSMQTSRNFVQNMVFTKVHSYRDEKEWRLHYKKDAEYAPFLAYDLSSVTLGHRSAEDLRASVIDLCRKYQIECYLSVPLQDKRSFGRRRII